MIPRKLAETLFRSWWLIVLPALIAPLAVFVTQKHALVYESVATAWVSDGSPLPQTTTRRYDPDATLASEQVQVMVDLMSTRAFREQAGSLAGIVDPAGGVGAMDAASEYLAAHVAVFAAGPNLVAVKASGPDPQEAQRMVAAVVASYQARLQASADQRATVSVEFFAAQVRSSQDELAKLQADLAAHRLANPVPAGKVEGAEAVGLQSRVDAQVRVVERLVESLTQAELNAASGAGAAASSFIVQDQASLPAAPLGVGLAARASLPAAALVVGALFGAVLLYLRYRGDHTIRSIEDVEGLAVPILAYVPEVRLQGTPSGARYLALLRPGNRDLARRAAAAISPLHGRTKAAS